jgi:D-proline reductase (dithiol) PrdB
MIVTVAEMSELSLGLRAFLRAYRWRRVDPVPLARMRKPLAEAKVALVSTAGFVAREQEPFDDARRGGDTSLRVIPDDVDVRTLVDTHRSDSFDHSGMRADANLAFPLDRLHELARDGVIGATNKRHLSFMGSITAPGRLVAESAPRGAEMLAADGVDAALLVPV